MQTLNRPQTFSSNLVEPWIKIKPLTPSRLLTGRTESWVPDFGVIDSNDDCIFLISTLNINLLPMSTFSGLKAPCEESYHSRTCTWWSSNSPKLPQTLFTLTSSPRWWGLRDPACCVMRSVSSLLITLLISFTWSIFLSGHAFYLKS